MPNSKIAVTVCNDKYFVWTVEDIMKLRRDHRTVGHLIGCNIRSSFQNSDLGIPLELSRFEAKILLDRQVIELVQVDRTKIDAELVQQYQADLKVQFEQYRQTSIEQKRAKLMENAKQICAVNRKRRKLGDDVTDEQIMEERLKQIDFTIEQFPITQHASCPHRSLIKPTVDHQLLQNEKDRAKFAIYEQLYNSGFYLTNGFKFSVDFLAYEGDPMVNHARYMIWITDRRHDLNSYDLLIKARLSVQVNKILLMATVKTNNDGDDQQPQFISITWKGKRPKGNNLD